jgi:site-specific DNA-cytosine methylase
MMSPVMVDLFSGLDGASAAMRDRGWRVWSLELDPAYRPSVVADVRRLPLREGLGPDLLWASPPCEEFARASMPWCHEELPPSMELFAATIEAVRLLRPRWWILENVKGAAAWARPALGSPHAAGRPAVPLGPHPAAVVLSGSRALERAAVEQAGRAARQGAVLGE